jgi:exodeoxyribonuclease VII small subunit
MPVVASCQRDGRSLTTPPTHGSVPIMTAKKNFNLEKSLTDLEAIVEELESGDLPLDKAMKKFEDGIKLTRGCQAALKDAEQKVEILLKSAGGDETLESFEPDD